MADSASQNYFTAHVLTNTGYALIVVTSATVITRFSIRIWKRKPLQVEDLLVGVSWASFLALTISYIVVTPPMYHVYAVYGGQAAPYPEIMDDALFIVKVFFYSTMLLWVTLWAVKFSLLALYRRLMNGLRTYIVLWWMLVVFCALTFIGAIISNLTSCSSMHAWFTPGLNYLPATLLGRTLSDLPYTGECATPRDIKAQIASLYYAFAVDVLTDLLVMALPIRLIWNLQMPRAEKLAVGALFCSGFVCITMAVLRVVQIGVKANNNTTPSSSWLALWAEVEAAIAVFIGCCPAFAAFYRTTKSESRGYSRPKDNRSGNSDRSEFVAGGGRQRRIGKEEEEGVALRGMTAACTAGRSAGGEGGGGSSSGGVGGGGGGRVPRRGSGKTASTYWDEANSSQEELAKGAQGIYVTRSIRQDSEDSGERGPMC
ncbi:CFEM domain-containing protein [Lasiodiplodia theobromae]|uniref:CFEM domain-containing protein n=1 Tax=Lasiodiplodia theobromae TaxID=45133 RepID=UPI0015C3C692|nr:CFEM domain-containing protein [Lasiodiplodia theobromae]KAF4539730.1 CFEM domain-containing protein [Lasiodiplodia theobromae]